MKFRTCD